MSKEATITICVEDMVNYIKSKLDYKVDADLIESILDLEECYLEELGVIDTI